MVGDSVYITLDWHDHLLAAGVVPIAPYNARNTDDLLDIQPKQSTLAGTYSRRTGVERTNESVKDCGLQGTHIRGRVLTRAQVVLALWLRLVVAITNSERGDNPGSTVITG
jgi:hypothetical protein